MNLFSFLLSLCFGLIIAICIEIVFWCIGRCRRKANKFSGYLRVFRFIFIMFLGISGLNIFLYWQVLTDPRMSRAMSISRSHLQKNYEKIRPGGVVLHSKKHVPLPSDQEEKTGFYVFEWSYYGTSVTLKVEYRITSTGTVYQISTGQNSDVISKKNGGSRGSPVLGVNDQ